MPAKAFKICTKPGCNSLTKERYCVDHKQEAKIQENQRKAAFDRSRGNSNQRGYTYKWSKARALFLRLNPFCLDCERKTKGLKIKANVVDHIVPHKGDMKLFWDRSNWQPLCKRCHDIKTATKDGGFGSKINQSKR